MTIALAAFVGEGWGRARVEGVARRVAVARIVIRIVIYLCDRDECGQRLLVYKEERYNCDRW